MKEPMQSLDCFETGPIRPPSEAGSLLIRVTRNCPWNRCAFCHTYRGEKYSRRRIDEVVADVRAAAGIAASMRSMSEALGEGGEIGDRTVSRLRADPSLSHAHALVANFLVNGGETVFLQDADPLAGPVEDSAAVLREIRSAFPKVRRVTAYCRSKTAARIGVEGFRTLKAAGLDRVHIGMESGSAAVLEFISKGSDPDTHVRGGRAVKDAGLELSEYFMPGLGGVALSLEHAAESAKVVNAIGPDFVRLRTLAVVGSADLCGKVESGEMALLPEDDVVREIRLFVESLSVPVRVESDHILNLLQEVEGDLPRDRDAILGVIDAYIAMPEAERVLFKMGRRLNYFLRLRDVRGPMRGRVELAIGHMGIRSSDDADEAINEMKARFV